VSRLFNDPSALYLITQPAARGREDYFFNSPGIQACTPAPCPVTTTLSPSRNPLQAPRFANWSLGWEHNLPKAIYLKVECAGGAAADTAIGCSSPPGLSGESDGGSSFFIPVTSTSPLKLQLEPVK